MILDSKNNILIKFTKMSTIQITQFEIESLNIMVIKSFIEKRSRKNYLTHFNLNSLTLSYEINFSIFLMCWWPKTLFKHQTDENHVWELFSVKGAKLWNLLPKSVNIISAFKSAGTVTRKSSRQSPNGRPHCCLQQLSYRLEPQVGRSMWEGTDLLAKPHQKH